MASAQEGPQESRGTLSRFTLGRGGGYLPRSHRDSCGCAHKGEGCAHMGEGCAYHMGEGLTGRGWAGTASVWGSVSTDTELWSGLPLKPTALKM